MIPETVDSLCSITDDDIDSDNCTAPTEVLAYATECAAMSARCGWQKKEA
jgi:hypothetical protein